MKPDVRWLRKQEGVPSDLSAADRDAHWQAFEESKWENDEEEGPSDPIDDAILNDDVAFFHDNPAVLWDIAMHPEMDYYLVPRIVADGAWECLWHVINQTNTGLADLESPLSVSSFICTSRADAESERFNENVPLACFMDSLPTKHFGLDPMSHRGMVVPTTSIPAILLSNWQPDFSHAHDVHEHNRLTGMVAHIFEALPAHAGWQKATGTWDEEVPKDVRVLELMHYARDNQNLVNFFVG